MFLCLYKQNIWGQIFFVVECLSLFVFCFFWNFNTTRFFKTVFYQILLSTLSVYGFKQSYKQQWSPCKTKTCPLRNYRHFPATGCADILVHSPQTAVHGRQDRSVEILPCFAQDFEGRPPPLSRAQPEACEGFGWDRKIMGTPQRKLRKDDQIVYAIADDKVRFS